MYISELHSKHSTTEAQKKKKFSIFTLECYKTLKYISNSLQNIRVLPILSPITGRGHHTSVTSVAPIFPHDAPPSVDNSIASAMQLDPKWSGTSMFRTTPNGKKRERDKNSPTRCAPTPTNGQEEREAQVKHSGPTRQCDLGDNRNIVHQNTCLMLGRRAATSVWRKCNHRKSKKPYSRKSTMVSLFDTTNVPEVGERLSHFFDRYKRLCFDLSFARQTKIYFA